MNKIQIIGLIMIFLSLTALIIFIIIKYNGDNKKEQDINPNHINPLEEGKSLPLTDEQKAQGIKGIYEDEKTGVLLIDK